MGGGKGRKKLQPQDFMPDYFGQAVPPDEPDEAVELANPAVPMRPVVAVSPKPVKQQQTWQEQASFIEMLHLAITGTEVKIPLDEEQ